jgi:hypothetical protein
MLPAVGAAYSFAIRNNTEVDAAMAVRTLARPPASQVDSHMAICTMNDKGMVV